MKNSITIGIFLLSLTGFANKSIKPITSSIITELNRKVIDVCSITETRDFEGFSITLTIRAATCEEVQNRLDNLFAKAKKAITAA